MSEERTEVFGAYKGDDMDAYNGGYDDRPRPKILWGRVGVLGIFLLVAFLLGRMTAPEGGGISSDRLQQAVSERDAALAQAEDLQTQLAAAQSEPATEPTAEPTSGGGGQAEVQTYTIQKGDTLSTIAEEFYGDPSLDDYLAEYNNIEDPTSLHVGQKIQIPPKPEN